MVAPQHALSPDDEIAALIAAGEHRQALTLLCETLGESLGRTCMALLGSQAEAEEAAQEALVAAFRGMAKYRAEGTVRAWVFGIARRQCASRLDKRTRRRGKLHLLPEVEPAGGPAEPLTTKRRAEALRRALETLKAPQRDAVVLRYQAGLEYGEIAVALGIDESAVRKRVSRGIAALRSILGSEDLE